MIRVLSYNISWRSMIIGQHNKCPTITEDTGIAYTSCLKNIATFVENNKPYDFVGFQEATNWPYIRRLSNTLSNMNYSYYKEWEREEWETDMVTFYDKKYILDDSESIIIGHMEDTSRPIIILFFQQKICVINVHAGHWRDIYKFDQHLMRTLVNQYARSIDIFLDKLRKYDIIMMGDFNHDLGGNNFRIFNDSFFNEKGGRLLYGINTKPTCCDIYNRSGYVKYASDQVLSTFPLTESTVIQVTNASDHFPIISDITILKQDIIPSTYHNEKIGYDFDGVLHKDVKKADQYGQRHPINFRGPYTPFDKIVDQINDEIRQGYNVYIIIPRTANDQETITKFLEKTFLPEIVRRLKVYYQDRKDKKTIIRDLGINIYYDDSCSKIVELYNGMQSGELPDLHNLFLVRPEDDTWIKITDENVSKECSIKQTTSTISTIQKRYNRTTKMIGGPEISRLNKKIDDKRIGYDFDGVLHISVSEPDEKGIRYIDNLTGPYIPYNRIINQIHKQLLNNYIVCIISSRKESTIEETIQNFLKNTVLEPYINEINVIILPDNMNKVDIIKSQNLYSFYDDNCFNIIHIHNAMKNGLLPNLEQLVLVKPEIDKWVSITDSNIKWECDTY
jgi:endonuclease/exonuclease/phosphatase family metal-dependent hydrolase